MNRLILIAFILITSIAFSQERLTINDIELTVDDSGNVNALSFPRHGEMDTIFFRTEKWAGPQWYGIWDEEEREVKLQASGKLTFKGIESDLEFGLEYGIDKNVPYILASVKKCGIYHHSTPKVRLAFRY